MIGKLEGKVRRKKKVQGSKRMAAAGNVAQLRALCSMTCPVLCNDKVRPVITSL